jgi:hypothetical protein
VIPHDFICASASVFISAWQIESGQNLWTIHEDDDCINDIRRSPDAFEAADMPMDSWTRLFMLMNFHRVRTAMT